MKIFTARKMSIGILLVFAVFGVYVIANPLRKSEEDIRKYVLNKTPIGTMRTDVRAVLDSNNWDILQDRESGYGVPSYSVRGTNVFEAKLGEYFAFPIPFTTTVVALWGFDENNRLIDIALRKETDGP